MAKDQLTRDGVRIDLPRPEERTQFAQWLARNNINEPFHPDQHYDYVGAFRTGIDRDGESAHFPDTYKLPGHPTFSNESQYAQGNMAKYAGSWPENTQSDADFIPPAQKYKNEDEMFANSLRALFDAITSAKR